MDASSPRPPPPGGHHDPRRIAAVVWGAMVAILVAFLAMALAIERPEDDPNASRALLFWTAVGASVLGIALSRAVAERIPARQAHPGARAVVRFVVAWAICEAVAIYPLVAHMLAHDHRLLGVFAVDLLALVTLYPSRNAWAHLAAVGAEPPAHGTVP